MKVTIGELDALDAEYWIGKYRESLAANGYIVIDPAELPEMTEDWANHPRLPAHYGDHLGQSKSEAYRQEALGKLALSLRWEQIEKRQAKMREGLVRDLTDSLSPQAFTALRGEYVADYLLERGWRRG